MASLCQLSVNSMIFHMRAKPERNLSSKNIIYSFSAGWWSNMPLLSHVTLSLFKQRSVIFLCKGCRKKRRNISRSEQFLSLLEKWQIARDSTATVLPDNNAQSWIFQAYSFRTANCAHLGEKHKELTSSREAAECSAFPPATSRASSTLLHTWEIMEPKIQWNTKINFFFFVYIFERHIWNNFPRQKLLPSVFAVLIGWCVISWECFTDVTYQIKADLSGK